MKGASDNGLQLATDLADVGFWDVDPVHDVLVWPARVKAMFGISPDVPVSMADFYAGLHPEDRHRVSAAYADASDPAKRSLYDVEYRTIGKEDGVVRWVGAKGRGVFDENRRCVRVIGTAIDISERKRREANLAFLAEVSQELTRLTHIDDTMSVLGARIGAYFHTIHCHFGFADQEQQTVTVTHEWKCADSPSLIGTHRIDDFHTEDFRQAMRAGEVYVVRDASRDPRANAEQMAALSIGAFVSVPLIRDGEWRFILSTFDRAPRDWHPDEIELLREITTRIWTRLERVRAEQDRDRFALLADNSRDFVGICTPDHIPTYVNPAGLRLVGLDSLEQAGRTPVAEFFFPEDWAMIRDEFFPRVARDGAGEVEVRFRHFKTGEAIWMTYGVVALKGPAGALAGLACVSRDVTGRKWRKKRCAKARRAIERSLTRWTRVTASSKFSSMQWDNHSITASSK